MRGAGAGARGRAAVAAARARRAAGRREAHSAGAAPGRAQPPAAGGAQRGPHLARRDWRAQVWPFAHV